ncbi:Elongation factor 2 [Astathelohania contejeani]|uniref:Elongation factor 2 n=1 Tax=Astathelohania contejeani TaxID=164912 RepID=A0ABQ7I0Z5_9MICR|nr:Elongation factor 2 [Thelohania contejeani]
MHNTIITSIIAHIDHGKTTLIDSLVATQGVISKSSAGNLRYLDTREDEQRRGITLKLSAITLQHISKHIIIDTPGHVDFESLVEASSYLSDVFVIIIDVSEGITPRTISLTNFVKNHNCVLVLNKIDKLINMELDLLMNSIDEIINRMNGLLTSLETQFNWKYNNIIIACSTLCYGINKNILEKVIIKNNIKAKNSLRNGLKFLKMVNEKIEKNETKKIMEAMGIKSNDGKAILSGMFSLAESVFSSIETTFKPKPKNYMGVSTYSVLKLPFIFTKENILFVTRLHNGTLNAGDYIYCKNNVESKKCQIEALYKFGLNGYIQVESVKSPTLVAIKADMIKNCIISLIPQPNYIEIKSKPFYKAKIRSKRNEELKEKLRTMVYTEPLLKVKLNKFGDFELICEGKVQFEKILADLDDVEVKDFEELFCETISKDYAQSYECEGYKCNIKLEQISEMDSKAGDPKLINVESEYASLILSVYELFITRGPLIEEPIKNTKFTIILENSTLEDVDINLFSYIKNCLKTTFMNANPKILAYFYECTLNLCKEYLGAVYECLQKFQFIMIDENYEHETEFFIIKALIPQFSYISFIEEVRLRTKGSVYISLKEFGYMVSYKFDKHIEKIRRKKGLFLGEKLVENPEKQRTLKK